MKMKIRYTIELDDGQTEANEGLTYEIEDGRDVNTVVKQLLMDVDDLMGAMEQMEEDDMSIKEYRDQMAERGNLHRHSRRDP